MGVVERNRTYDIPFGSRVLTMQVGVTVDTVPSIKTPWKFGEVEASIAMDTGFVVTGLPAFELRFAVTDATTSGC